MNLENEEQKYFMRALKEAKQILCLTFGLEYDKILIPGY